MKSNLIKIVLLNYEFNEYYKNHVHVRHSTSQRGIVRVYNLCEALAWWSRGNFLMMGEIDHHFVSF